jgi:GTPase involved in cell partitioning and DNA repair
MLEKDEHVFLTKSDMVSPEELKEKLAKLKKAKISAIAISVLDDASMEVAKKALRDLSPKVASHDTQ